MPYPYITPKQLSDRLGPTALARAADDQDLGVADPDAIASVIADASSKVAGYLRGNYSLDSIASNTPREVVRLTLDVAVAYLAQREPGYFRVDWAELMRQADRELTSIRRGDTRLDVEGAPEPAANTGGNVESGNPQNPTTYCPVYQFGLGDYSR